MPACPKPTPRPKKERQPMRRSGRLKAKGRSRFPKVRNERYRAWIRSLACLLAGRVTAIRLTTNDIHLTRGGWRHICWGPIDPAHVNETQARGAGDVGECVPLCRAAHRALDQRLGAPDFASVTALNLSYEAAGLALMSGGAA